MSAALLAHAFLTAAPTYAIVCLGLSVPWGQTGVFDVGVAGFVPAGAYATDLLTGPAGEGRLGGFDLPIALGWAAAAALGAVLSLVVGWLTIRLRADYLAIAPFGFAVVARIGALNLEGLTGGPFGLSLPRPFGALAGERVAFGAANLALVAGVSPAVALALGRLARSPRGRVLRAARDDEAAARSLCQSPHRFRLQAFAIGGAIMALAGALQGQFVGFVAPDDDLPILTSQGLGHADRGRRGRPARRGAGRGAGLGAPGGIGRPRGGARPVGEPGAGRPAPDRADRRGPLHDPALAPARPPRRAAAGLAPRRPRPRPARTPPGIGARDAAEREARARGALMTIPRTPLGRLAPRRMLIGLWQVADIERSGPVNLTRSGAQWAEGGGGPRWEGVGARRSRWRGWCP